MPELPEVENVVDTLRPRLLGRRIASVVLNRTDILLPAGFDLPEALRGREIVDLSRRAKRIVFTLDDANQFYIHLGMTGRLTTCNADDELAKHTHVIMRLAPKSSRQTPHPSDAPTELRFCDPRRFGGVWWLGMESESTDLGPEPLQMRVTQFAKALSRTRRPIKSALLDQAVVAGLGNIYVDESLHHARLHPLRPADSLNADEVRALTRSIKLILRGAIKHGGSTVRDYVNADGDAGRFQNKHRVYGREAEKCRTCKSPIQRIVLGGRSTHFCAKCQPAS